MQLHPMSEDIELRFRHTSGDVGPLKCAGTMSVGAVKERLLSEWPKGGLYARDAEIDLFISPPYDHV